MCFYGLLNAPLALVNELTYIMYVDESVFHLDFIQIWGS